MAIGFGATLGTATTDKIDVAASTFPAQFSVHVFTNRNGDGGGGLGRILDRGAMRPLYNASAAEYGFTNGNNCFWRWNRPSAGIWVPLGMSVDASSAANDPIVYQAGTKLTVGAGITQINADSAYVTGSAVWTIGARTSTGVGWDGSLAEMAWWDVILTDEEFFALQKGISPDQIRPESLLNYFPLIRSGAINKTAAPGAVTGTAAQPHPAIILPHRRSVRKTTTASGGGPTAYFQNVSGSLTGAGALAKQTLRSFTASSTFTGTLSKSTSRAFAGSITATGELSKRTSKAFAGSMTAAGNLSTMILFTCVVDGSITVTGAIAKMTMKALAGASTLAGALNKYTFRTLDGSITPEGVLTKLTKKAFASSVTCAGALSESYQVLKSLAGSITPSGALAALYIAFVAGVAKFLALLGVGS